MEKALARELVEQAEWKDGSKVYDLTDDGELALWYDPESGKLHDWNESAPVANEAEADALAVEWLECQDYADGGL